MSLFCQTPESDLRNAGPGMLRWDVWPFIVHKKATMPKCALKQVHCTFSCYLFNFLVPVGFSLVA